MTRTQRRVGVLRRLDTVIGSVELTIGALSLMAILALVFTQAVQRYSPFEGFAWTGEIARFSLVWLSFSVAGLLITRRGHITLELVDSIRNPMVLRVIQTLALVIVSVVGVALTLEAISLISTQGVVRSAVLRIPMSWVSVPVLLGTASTAVRAAIAAVDIALHGAVVREGRASDEGASDGGAVTA